MNHTADFKLRLGGTATEEFKALLPQCIKPADQIVAFSDASWGGERPNVAAVLCEYGTPFNWHSKRDSKTGASSAEQELSGVIMCSLEVMFAREVKAFLIGVDLKSTNRATPVCTDNRAVCMLSDGDGTTKRMKHTVRELAMLKELVDAKSILMAWLPTNHCLADVLTKPMANIQFHSWRRLLVN